MKGMYIYRWPRFLWSLRRFLFGETWGCYMQRMKIPGEWEKEECKQDRWLAKHRSK